jgi:CYTH domain-containing protein/8-oxo-dGTP pyrophosphatase MutT (NUDIX family)
MMKGKRRSKRTEEQQAMSKDKQDGRISTLESLEIERKYLVRTAFFLDRLDSFPHFKIFQGYAVVGQDGREVRLRAVGDKYFLTVKGAGHLSRFETEITITQEQFDALWPATDGRQIEKTRYKINYHDSVIDLDVYEGKLQGLVTAEVEFPSEEASMEFTPPQWFGDEVTHDDRYKNMHLALFGAPRRSEEPAEPGETSDAIQQAAAVPFRVVDNQVEICLVTSVKGDCWTIPKGIIDHGQNAADAALHEAFEEAGIRGQIVGEPVGDYKYNKWGRKLSVSVLLMEVLSTEEDWPEAELRARCWVKPKKALKRIKKKKQRRLVKAAVKRLAGLYPSITADEADED